MVGRHVDCPNDRSFETRRSDTLEGQNSPAGVSIPSMNQRMSFPILFAGVLLLMVKSLPAGPEQVPTYLPASLPSILAVIKGPPDEGSVENAADLESVVRRQASAKTSDVERAKRSADPSLQTLFGKPHGPLPAADVQKLSRLFAVVADDTDLYVGQLKRTYKRLRPYARDSRIKCLGKPDKAFAYPSGAAAIASVFSRLLSDLYPSLRTEIERRASDIGDCRIVLGAHQPADIVTGTQLGEHLAKLFWNNARFQADLEKAIHGK